MSATERAEDDYDILLKVVTIGDSGVGKTGLIERYVKRTFSSNSRTTIGVEFAAKNISVGHVLVKAQLWDTAGQERFRAISTVYYRGCAAALLVFDLTNRQSFDGARRWLTELRSHVGPNCPVILIGNKSDLQNQRQVDSQEAIAFATKEDLMYMETSALAGDNVDAAFYELIEATVKRLGLDKVDLRESEDEGDGDGGDQRQTSSEKASSGGSRRISLSGGKTIDISEPAEGGDADGGGAKKGCCSYW